MMDPTGLILLDKPAGITSFSAVNRVRRILNSKKAGHTGTLDPMATGVLVILTNGAARFIEFLPTHRKAYRAGFQLGLATDTLDITGKVLSSQPVHVSREEISRALEGFRGKIMQTPPMVSAIKQDGVRLYALARQGMEVQRAPREVELYSLELSEVGGEYVLDAACSAGTYIRTLIDDLGRALGVGGAVMTSLRRTEANGYSIEQCATLEQFERGEVRIIPMEDALAIYPLAHITAPQATRFRNGGALDLQRLQIKNPTEGELYRVRCEDDFLGLGRVRGEQLAIARLLT